jgi:hypothetical protein
LEGHGKEEGSTSAEEVCHMAVHVDNSYAAFLLMAEATVMTATALLLLLGVGMTTIIPGLLLPRGHLGQ